MHSNSGLIIPCKLTVISPTVKCRRVRGSVWCRFFPLHCCKTASLCARPWISWRCSAVRLTKKLWDRVSAHRTRVSSGMSPVDVNGQRLRQSSERVTRKCQPSWNVRENFVMQQRDYEAWEKYHIIRYAIILIWTSISEEVDISFLYNFKSSFEYLKRIVFFVLNNHFLI
jgi:hypothetical protein